MELVKLGLLFKILNDDTPDWNYNPQPQRNQ